MIAVNPKDSVSELTVLAVKNKPRLWYVPGSGGQWVNYLLWCLTRGRVMTGRFDHFEFPQLLQRDSDYESLVEFVEHTDDPATANICLGSQQAWLNFYVNSLAKKSPTQSWESFARYLDELAQRNIEFTLEWTDIWQRPEKFLQDLGSLIGQELPYNWIAKQAIAQYSRTCVWMQPSQFDHNQHLLLPRHLRLAPARLRHSVYYPPVMQNPADSGNYCPLIYNSVYVEKVGQDQVRLSACCINHVGPDTQKIDFATDRYLMQQRDVVSRGLPADGCRHCYNATVNWQTSAIVTWSGRPVNHHAPRIQKLDYNVDPICNARCIQCSSYYSSAWLAEDQQHGDDSKTRQFGQTRRGRPWRELDLEDLEYLYINGGEPMLSSEPKEILQHLDQQGQLENLQFAFNTNGSIRPNDDLMLLLKRCRGVVINFSIDGIENEFEYIRNPLLWQEVCDNVQYLSQASDRFNLHVAYTVGIHNIDCVDRTMAWTKSTNACLNRPMKFTTHLCNGPLDLTNAEPALKQVWLDRLDGSQPWHQQVRPALLGPVAPQFRTWQQHLEMIDQRRNLNWQHSLPGLFESWKLSQHSV